MDVNKILAGLRMGLNIADAVKEAGGDILDPNVGLTLFFDRRFSNASTLGRTVDSLVYLFRDDFPSLSFREVVSFPSCGNTLKGYLYRTAQTWHKGLVLYVHGLTGQADDIYAIGQDRFLSAGYDVFAIDLTASGRSGGNGIPGLHQSALDVKAATEYLSTRGDLNGMPLFFFGHSWGAYGVAASLNFASVRPHAVAAVSGFDNPLAEMMAIPQEKVGFPIPVDRAPLEEALRRRAGEHYSLSASRGIAESGVPALVVHGQDDHTVPFAVSTYAMLGTSHAEKLLLPGGHMDLFFSPEAASRAKETKQKAGAMLKTEKIDLASLPKESLEQLRSCFDRRGNSILNERLFGAVDAFFTEHAGS